MSKTDFGYQEVEAEQKAKLVDQVFASVAGKYDVMNDVMSLGIHRLWKRFAVSQSRVKAGDRVLDLAGGTGDLALLMAAEVGKQGRVICADINSSMLRVGRDRLLDQGHFEGIDFVQVDAEQLPFPDNYFDAMCIGFGLRNVTDKQRALTSMYRALKPGGTLLVLEFSKPKSALVSKFYDWYSFKLLPKMGELIAQDAESYQYLAESIRRHPDQEGLKKIMLDSGFDKVDYHNLSQGIVALHKGYKY